MLGLLASFSNEFGTIVKKMYLSTRRGFLFQIDEGDLGKIKDYKISSCGRKNKKYFCIRIGEKLILLHRFLLDCPSGNVVDHINGDTSDNRRENLRVCSIKENIRNYTIPKNNTSGYKGVGYYKRLLKWRACIKVDGRLITIGYYRNLSDAVNAYNESAKKYFGEFAKLNNMRKIQAKKKCGK